MRHAVRDAITKREVTVTIEILRLNRELKLCSGRYIHIFRHYSHSVFVLHFIVPEDKSDVSSSNAPEGFGTSLKLGCGVNIKNKKIGLAGFPRPMVFGPGYSGFLHGPAIGGPFYLLYKCSVNNSLSY